MKQLPLISALRRVFATLALCAFVATATATWLSPAKATASSASSARVAYPASANSGPDEQPTPNDDEQPRSRRSKKTITGQLNLNTATDEQLQLLPGVGPAKAQRIIDYREKRGKFRRVKDLRRVKGFGPKTLKKLSPHLAIDGPNTLTVE